METRKITFRKPRLADGRTVWQAVEDSGALDPNSPYIYLMWCDMFSDASVIAEVDGAFAGFICGFRPPKRPDRLFVWQVATEEKFRGLGLASSMLREILLREKDLRFVEATVTPSNAPSAALFKSLAKRAGTECKTGPYAAAEDFPPNSGHEAELLFEIGPIDLDTIQEPKS